jgi:hypothetical protein
MVGNDNVSLLEAFDFLTQIGYFIQKLFFGFAHVLQLSRQACKQAGTVLNDNTNPPLKHQITVNGIPERRAP